MTELGLVVRLGHALGTTCANPTSRNLTVLDSNGVHAIAVEFCDCQSNLPHRKQLLEMRWFPATPIDPRTAFTFNLLRQFQYFNLQGGITSYEFYRALEFITDGRLSANLPVSHFRARASSSTYDAYRIAPVHSKLR